MMTNPCTEIPLTPLMELNTLAINTENLKIKGDLVAVRNTLDNKNFFRCRSKSYSDEWFDGEFWMLYDTRFERVVMPEFYPLIMDEVFQEKVSRLFE